MYSLSKFYVPDMTVFGSKPLKVQLFIVATANTNTFELYLNDKRQNCCLSELENAILYQLKDCCSKVIELN